MDAAGILSCRHEFVSGIYILAGILSILVVKATRWTENFGGIVIPVVEYLPRGLKPWQHEWERSQHEPSP